MLQSTINESIWLTEPSVSYCAHSWRDSSAICTLPSIRRHIHSSQARLKDQPREEDVRDPPRSGAQDPTAERGSATGETEGEQSGAKSSSQEQEHDGKEGQDRRRKKDAGGKAAPPPPHGNKTPWQVFTDTLRSEFESSKEWNESTKAIASSANQIAESESLKRARAAYTAASDAASSTTSSAIRTTGKALGKGAAWTWETPVVKGVRAGVGATGKAIEKGTRPVRETEAYKKVVGEVKEVIDDGSSSRYGGWAEKEERRRRRELRELNEAKASGRLGKRPEKMEEDPESVMEEQDAPLRPATDFRIVPAPA